MKKMIFIILAFAAVFSCTNVILEPERPITETTYSLHFGKGASRIFVASSSASIEITNDTALTEPLTITACVPQDGEAYVRRYNERNATDCTLAPEDLYTLSAITLPAGGTSALLSIEVDLEKVREAQSIYPFLVPVALKTSNEKIACHDICYFLIPTETQEEIDGAERTVLHYSKNPAKLILHDVGSEKAMLFIPGGGYKNYNVKFSSAYPQEYSAVQQGITKLYLCYRLPSPSGDAAYNAQYYFGMFGRGDLTLQDAVDAITLMRARASEWGGYERIGVMGRSAGGHLAMLLTETLPDMIDFAALLYPVVTMELQYSHATSAKYFMGDFPTQEAIDYYSTHKRVTTDLPPVWTCYSADDATVLPEHNVEPLVDSLKKYGVDVTVHKQPIGGHGSTKWPDYPAILENWLNTK